MARFELLQRRRVFILAGNRVDFLAQALHRHVEADQVFGRRQAAQRFTYLREAVLDAGKSRRVNARLAAVVDALAQRLDLVLEVFQRAPRQGLRNRAADFRKFRAQRFHRFFQFGGWPQGLDPRRQVAQLLLETADIDGAPSPTLCASSLSVQLAITRSGWRGGAGGCGREAAVERQRRSSDNLTVEGALPRRDFGYGLADRGVALLIRRRARGRSFLAFTLREVRRGLFLAVPLGDVCRNSFKAVSRCCAQSGSFDAFALGCAQGGLFGTFARFSSSRPLRVTRLSARSRSAARKAASSARSRSAARNAACSARSRASARSRSVCT